MARYGRDFGMRGGSIRYGMDYDRGSFLGRGDRSWGREIGGMDRGRGLGFDRGLGGGYGARRSARYGLDYGDRETFRAGGHDRGPDLGDRLREGWHDLERGARRLMGRGRGYRRGYDRGW